jgi:TP901 family phage tail tape measure protein
MSALAGVKGGIAGVNGAAKDSAAAWNTFGNTAIIAGAAAAAGLGEAVKVAANFESQLTDVRIAGHFTAEEMDAIKKSMLGWQIGASLGQMTSALSGVTHAGYGAHDAWQIAQVAIKATAALGGDAEQNAKALSVSMAVFGASAKDAAKYEDILVTASEKGKFAIGDMAGFLPRAAQAAFRLGLSFQQMGGFMEAASHVTGNARTSAMAMTSMMNALADAGYGARIKSEGLIPVLREIAAQTDLTDAQLKKLLGGDTGFNMFVQLRKNGFADLTAGMNDAGAAAGALERALQLMGKDLAYQLKELARSAASFAVQVGDDLLPQIKELTDWLSHLNTGDIEAEAHAIADLGVVLVGLGGAGAAVRVVGQAIKTFTELRAAMVAVGALAGSGALIGSLVTAGALADVVLLVADLEKYLELEFLVQIEEAKTTKALEAQWGALADSEKKALESMAEQFPALAAAVHPVQDAIKKVKAATTDVARAAAWQEYLTALGKWRVQTLEYAATHKEASAAVLKSMDEVLAKAGVVRTGFQNLTTDAQSIEQASSPWRAFIDNLKSAWDWVHALTSQSWKMKVAWLVAPLPTLAGVTAAMGVHNIQHKLGGQISAMSPADLAALGLTPLSRNATEEARFALAGQVGGAAQSRIAQIQAGIPKDGEATAAQQAEIERLTALHDMAVKIKEAVGEEVAQREGILAPEAQQLEALTMMVKMSGLEVGLRDKLIADLQRQAQAEQAQTFYAEEAKLLNEALKKAIEARATALREAGDLLGRELEKTDALAKVTAEITKLEEAHALLQQDAALSVGQELGYQERLTELLRQQYALSAGGQAAAALAAGMPALVRPHAGGVPVGTVDAGTGIVYNIADILAAQNSLTGILNQLHPASPRQGLVNQRSEINSLLPNLSGADLEAAHAAIADIDQKLADLAKHGSEEWKRMSEQMGEDFTRALSGAIMTGKMDLKGLTREIESQLLDAALKPLMDKATGAISQWLSGILSPHPAAAAGATPALGKGAEGAPIGLSIGAILGGLLKFDDPIADLAASRSGGDFVRHFTNGMQEGALGTAGKGGASRNLVQYNHIQTTTNASPAQIAGAVARRTKRSQW